MKQQPDYGLLEKSFDGMVWGNILEQYQHVN